MIHNLLRPGWRDLAASASERSFPRLSSGLQGAASIPLDCILACAHPTTGLPAASPHGGAAVTVGFSLPAAAAAA